MRAKAHHKVLLPKEDLRRFEKPSPRPEGRPTTLIHNASQVLTIAGGSSVPRTREKMADLRIITEGAVAIQEGRIVALGPSEPLKAEYSGATAFDARGGVVMPGFVDPHTHLVFAGDRVEEADMKAMGLSYSEIAERGGGILTTVGMTRKAPTSVLVQEAKRRLDAALMTGTTLTEVKTGYALDAEGELRLLDVITALDSDHPVTVVPTLMAAHAIPPEYEGRKGAFLEMIARDILPESRDRGAVYCDVFCEEGYFTVDESRDLLMEARRNGLDAKIHADELTQSGGAELAGEIGALSADHLLHASEEGLRSMAEAMAVGVLLPGTSLTTGGRYADARKMIRMGVPVALGTDMNPNCWVTSMPLVLSLAVYRMGMTAAEAIVASTLNAAHALGVASEVGSLEVGKAADVLVLSVDDYRKVPYQIGANPVRAVFKNGALVRGGAG
jgi:imidazolonepropionase